MGRRNQLAAPQTAFDPARLRGLELWLDGADAATLFQDIAATTPATAVNNPVGYWRDKSGFNRHATQGTAANRPVVATHSASGKTVLSFDGANDFLSSGTTDSWRFLHNGTPHNIFVVYSITTASICGVLATGTTNTSTGFDILAHTTFFRHGAMNASAGPNVIDNSVTLTATNSNMRTLRVRGFAASTPAADRSTMFADGATQYKNNTTTGTAATGASTHPLIIGARGGTNIPLAGTIAEVMIFNSMASETDLQQVEQYLLRKWAVTEPAAVSSPLDIPNCAIWLDGADTSTMYTGSAGPVTPVTAPTDIAGCIGWWDASDASSITQSGGLISQWNDKSGNGKHATASGTARPMYTGTRNGRNVITFDGVANRLSTSLNDRATQTLFVVARNNDVDSGVRRSVSYRAERSIYNGVTQWNWFSPTVGINGAPTSEYSIAGVVIASNTSLTAYGNGALSNAAPADPFDVDTSRSLTIGSEVNAVNCLNGTMAEVIVFDSALSNVDRARIERYLALKWGVRGVHTTAAGTGDPVRYWGDKSGGGRHFTSPSSAPQLQAMAINSLPALEFNNSNMRCTGRSDVVTQETVFLVASVTNTANFSRFFTQVPASGGADWQVIGHWIPLLRNATATNLCSYADANGRASVSLTNAIHTIMTSTHTGSTIANTANGVASAPYSHVLSQTIATYGIFEDLTGGSAFSNGRVMEAIVYHRAISASEHSRVIRYLQNKWGVGLVPPVASHPDAQDWVKRVYFNGGTCSQNTVDAVSSFCREIDSAGLRSKFYRLNLFCGNELIACRTTLYRGPNANERHGFDMDVLTVGSGGSILFSNADYTEYGINGGLASRLQAIINAHAGPGLRTGIVPALIPAFYGPQRPSGPSYNYSSLHLATYIRTLRDQTLGTGVLIGAYGGFGTANDARHGMTFSVGRPSWYVGPFSASVGGAYEDVNRGLYLANVRVTSELLSNDYVNEMTLYAGSMRYATGRSTLGPFLHPNIDFGIFGECRAAIANSQIDNSLFRAQQTLQGYSIGLGMTEAEVQTYNQIMNRFQNRLGRGLPENTMPAFATISNLDTRDWLTRVYAAGGNVSTSTAEAVQTFCNAVTTAGIRDRFFRLNLFCGNNLEACVVPLYRGQTRTGTQYGNLTDWNGNFISSDYVETGLNAGLKGLNSASKSLRTGLLSSDLPTDDRHMSLIETELSNEAFPTLMGVEGTINGDMWRMDPSGVAGLTYRSASNTSGAGLSQRVARRLYVGTTTAVNATQCSVSMYENNSLVGGPLTVPRMTAPNLEVAIFCSNRAGSLTYYASARLACYSIGLGLNATQIAAYSTAMQAFQTALSRSV
jgi:hypothetical protein